MPTEARAPARAALAGNPSDGYRGAVVGIALQGHFARAWIGDGDPLAPDLVEATLARFRREFGCAAPVSVETTIPRSVGLGGSSAIVIAVLRALCAEHAVELAPTALAELALSIEVDDLGISAGLQDRLVQSHGGLVLMDFAGEHPVVERLDPRLLPPLLVAWQDDAAEHSGVVHSDLRARFGAGEPAVRDAMVALARHAHAAAEAVSAQDRERLCAAVDASFDIRAELLELDPRHVAMIRAARDAGAAANYTGSGGAVVCVCADLDHRESVAHRLRAGGSKVEAVVSDQAQYTRTT